MALNARQQSLYTDLCDIYQETRQSNTDGIGTPGNETNTKIASGVLYYHQTTKNFPDLTVAGRIIEANILTTDLGHFDVAQPVPDNALIVNKSMMPDGKTRSALYGRVYRVLSQDQSNPVRGSRMANKAVFPLRLVEKAPAGVS